MTDTAKGWASRLPRRHLLWIAAAAIVVLCIAALQLSRGAAAQEEAPTVTAQTGNIVVTVGGVGRVVSATPTVQVYPQVTSQVAKVVVSRGESVEAGQVVAVLDDGGAAAAAIDQARADVETARIDLRQRRSSRPVDVSAARLDLKRAQADLEALLGGTPGSRERAIRLVARNIQLAQARLDQLLAPPESAAVRAAEAELRRAEAALASLMKPPPSPSPQVLAAAQQAVVVARQNLTRAQATGTPAEISAAQLELYRAEAELAALRQLPAGPLPEEIAAANAAVTSAKANLDKLYGKPSAADVQSARLELQRARAELRQLQAGPSARARASARAAIESARDRLGQSGSRFGIDLAQETVDAARARLASARAAASLLRVPAPVAGVVTAVQVAPGSTVDPTTPIVTISTPGQLAVTVDLSEFDVARVEDGQKATVSVDALGGESFPGTVVYVAPTGTDTNGVVTFPVQISLRSAEDVKPGMNVSARIVVASEPNVVLVPLEAVSYDDEDQASVTIVDESGQETVRDVQVGLTNNTNAEIVKGVSAGENVVLAESQAPQEEEE